MFNGELMFGSEQHKDVTTTHSDIGLISQRAYRISEVVYYLPEGSEWTVELSSHHKQMTIYPAQKENVKRINFWYFFSDFV